ncbi:dihydrofolate reductase [Friedmanniella endophytica]|uniref:Dihydrofolate reductase n=1 Tax=Microlunatus kandeliicorticis TaxID=1759536 RepID=A0A7W3INV8_9ACTN|nr:dihydrofolate reductase [Microlunatus kandeliicorticis]
MSDLVVVMSMSLDGFVAAPGDGSGAGLGVGGKALHAWLAPGDADPTTHRPAGGADAAIFDELLATGAVLTGHHTSAWAGEWGGDHHDGVPVFVLTRTPPATPVQGLVHYVSDPADAAARAKAAAGDRDALVHGASSVQALHAAGLVDRYLITLVPIVLGAGKRLFAAEPESGRLQLTEAVPGRDVLHLRYRVGPRCRPVARSPGRPVAPSPGQPVRKSANGATTPGRATFNALWVPRGIRTLTASGIAAARAAQTVPKYRALRAPAASRVGALIAA